MSFPRYEHYKESGVEWLGEVPEHWSVIRLKRACDIYPSNVDKRWRNVGAAMQLHRCLLQRPDR